MKRILVLDPTEAIRAKVTESLGENFEIIMAPGLPPYFPCDLVVLDLLSVNNHGLPLCSSIRQNLETQDLPIVCLTDGNSETAVAGYLAGADDCFSIRTGAPEFLAKILARTKSPRNRVNANFQTVNGLLSLNTINQTLTAKANQDVTELLIDLTPHEIRLLLFLLDRSTQIVSREDLQRAVWNNKVNVLPRTIDKHVSALRDKVKDICAIESVRGNGYILNMKPKYN
jgi:DNA-binding response OmpR family regulator